MNCQFIIQDQKCLLEDYRLVLSSNSYFFGCKNHINSFLDLLFWKLFKIKSPNLLIRTSHKPKLWQWSKKESYFTTAGKI